MNGIEAVKWLMQQDLCPLHTLDRPYAQQSEKEFSLLLEAARGVKSVLEIGSCFGHSLLMLADVAEKGAKFRAIDLGVLPEEAGEHAGFDLRVAINRTEVLLRERGIDALFGVGNSHDPEVIKWAKEEGPYDFVFIDGDHSYEGVKSDWENYGPLGRMVAFHDIVHPSCGVGRLWSEIKEQNYKTDEYIQSCMGIGIVFRDKETV